MFFEKFPKLWIFKKLKEYFFDLVFFEIDKKKIAVNIESINYDPYIEIRDIKFTIINFYLDKIKLNQSYRIQLFNSLFISDQIFHRKACLIKFLIKKKKSIKKISAVFLSKEDLQLFNLFHLNVRDLKTNKIFREIINIILIFLSILAKFIRYNKELKLFPENKSIFNKNIIYNKILRTWVDLAENIYVNQLKKSLNNTIMHVNPGYIRELPSKRQEKYLEYLKKNNRNYFFYVPKIKIYEIVKKAIKLCFNSEYGEFKLSLITIIFQRHQIDNYVNYLIKKFPNVKKFYTEEEFQTETTYLTEKLQEYNIKVINFAHGNGVYCPIVNYDVFYVYSKMQKDYYITSTEFKYFNWDLSPKDSKNYSIQKIAILFIAQNVLTSPAVYSFTLRSSYKEIMKYIEKLAEDKILPIFIKYHPNSRLEDKLITGNVFIIQNLNNLPPGYNYLTITYYSSYVIELLNKMPFLYINPEDKTDLKYLFPSDEQFYAKTYQEFKAKVENFINNPGYYFEYWNKLMKFFQQK